MSKAYENLEVVRELLDKAGDYIDAAEAALVVEEWGATDKMLYEAIDRLSRARVVCQKSVVASGK